MKLLGGISSQQNGKNAQNGAAAESKNNNGFGEPAPSPAINAAQTEQDGGQKHNVMADVIMRHESVSNRVRSKK